MHQCIRINDPEIYKEIEALHPFVRRVLFDEVLELRESGRVSGIMDVTGEFIGVEVDLSSESLAQFHANVKEIVVFLRYVK
jgi:hypothetical protein